MNDHANNHSNNHAMPAPASGPGPLCSAYGPLLPLLQSGELASDQAAATREHLAGCAWCRARLASYDALYAALRTRFDPDLVAAYVRVPSVREIAALGAESARGAAHRASAGAGLRVVDADLGEPDVRGRTVPWRPPIRIEVVAAVLLVALLGALFALIRAGGIGGPPPLDAQSRAYVAVLRADYLPLLNALGADSRQCVSAFDKAPQSDKPQDMLDCRPVQVTALADSQTLLAHLQSTPAPSRWRTADGQLKTWTQTQIDFYTARIQAIDAHDLAHFTTLGDQGSGSTDSCTAIEQINADLPADGQLPANAFGYCGA